MITITTQSALPDSQHVAQSWATGPKNLLAAIRELPAWRRQMKLVSTVNSVTLAIDGHVVESPDLIGSLEEAREEIARCRKAAA